MSGLAIRTDRLRRDFSAIRAVDELSLQVPAGIVFGLLGPNGSGKTTTIRLLLGLLEPTDGTAVVLGCDMRKQADEVRQRSGALLEHSGLYERLSAEQNLDFYGRVWRLGKPQRQSRIQELLTHVGLWERRKEPVVTWSRGMRQKLAVARALLHRPELVFMDEPTSGLDPVAAAALHEDLLKLATLEGVTFFLTTHNLAEAEKLCRQVGVIRQGRLVAMGAPEDLRRQVSAPQVEILASGVHEGTLALLRQRPEVSKVELAGTSLSIELTGNVDVAPLVSLIVGEGGQVEEVHKSRATLEQVFLKLMEEEA